MFAVLPVSDVSIVTIVGEFVVFVGEIVIIVDKFC